MAGPVVSPVRRCGPASGERGLSAAGFMSLSHSLAADVLIADISNMLRSARSFVRQHGNISMLEGFDESTSWFDRLMRRFKRAETAVARTVGQPEVIHLAVSSRTPTPNGVQDLPYGAIGSPERFLEPDFRGVCWGRGSGRRSF